MSVKVVDLHGGRKHPLISLYLGSVSLNGESKGELATALMCEMLSRVMDGLVDNIEAPLGDKIVGVLHHDREFAIEDKFLGRIGVREITSAWALQRYPDAAYEAVVTLRFSEDDIQVFLIYL